jgi:hypothetical protein
MKKIKVLLGLSLMVALTFSVHAGGKTGGTTTTTSSGFTFSYKLGTVVTNYHIYAVVSQVGSGTQPKGTVVLDNWWVKDLGKAAASGTVTCPPPVTPKGTSPSVLGILLFANAKDVGGQPYTNPVIDVQIFTPKWYNGYASIQCMPPIDGDADDSGIQIYWGAPFSPFQADLSAYVWNVEPATGW